MISLVVAAFLIYSVIVIFHPSPTLSNQNERIILHEQYPDDNYGYVKISDIKPGDYGFFMYPSSYNYSDKWNSYQRFLLIRLPSWLGGDTNDISSFRAYSQLDIASHCLVFYHPNYEQNMHDPCWYERYRTIDGAASYQSIKFLVKPIHNAIPNLDLALDGNGYISVKPPTWTADKNGIVGEGRILSTDEIRNSSNILLQDWKKMSGLNLNIPLRLETGEYLLMIDAIGSRTGIDYQNLETWNGGAHLEIEPCNCSKRFYDNTYGYEQLRQVNGIPMAVHAEGVKDNKTGEYQSYMVSFEKDGYWISLSETKSLQVITNEILNDYFKDAINSK